MSEPDGRGAAWTEEPSGEQSLSGPEGRGAAWTEERGTSDEGRQRIKSAPEASGEQSHEAAGRIIALLTAREQTVAVAESLTGGLLAAALTSIPGASAAFRGAVVAYAISLKATLLDVPRPMLDALGAVSPEVAAAMAEGVRRRLEATFGAATTGVAGPDPAEGKPVGTVHVAVSAACGTTVRTLALAGGRDEVRQRTVEAVLSLLLHRVREECS
jgi:PncC family amidohydrolase